MEPKLCREICKHCWNSYCDSEGNMAMMGIAWEKLDENTWKTYGQVFCNEGHEWFAEWKDFEEAFQQCPYRLEHIVIGEKQDDETI